ncbi:hypothetical protein [Tenacibaculum phage Larrie]|nr:hypothetical protein [Tenacibaculum phage Larrie]
MKRVFLLLTLGLTLVATSCEQSDSLIEKASFEQAIQDYEDGNFVADSLEDIQARSVDTTICSGTTSGGTYVRIHYSESLGYYARIGEELTYYIYDATEIPDACGLLN